MAKRVFQLAKELNVTSKQVLEKCRAEGLELKNHMAALSAGLEATIREWFSDSESSTHTAVEVSDAVDLEAAHRKAAAARRRRKKTEPAAEEAAEVEEVEEAAEAAEAGEAEEAPVVEAAAEAPVEAPEAVEAVEAPAVEAPAAEAEAPAEAEVETPAAAEEAAPVEAPAEEAPVEEAPAVAAEAAEAPVEAAAPTEEAPAAEAAEAAEPKEAEPEKPKPEAIVPAGPQLVPKPAQLQGPRVIRVERPDILPTPRRRPRPEPAAGGYNGGGGGGGYSGDQQGGGGDAGRSGGPKRGHGRGGAAAEKRRRNSPRRRGGRGGESGEGLREWRDRDLTERRERLAAATGGGLRRHRASIRRGGEAMVRTGPAEVEEPITLKSLSAAMGVKSADMIKKLMMSQGMFVTVTQTISAETAEMLAADYGVELKIKRHKSHLEQLDERLGQRETGEQIARPPVVTFLGHVDHGKTSLLDCIRKASVVDTESGGITQHIGSYRYEKGGMVVTFLDTPGHEAFTQMRARGANMTDVVVLVVAADDGVMPQTVEAISHAKAAEVPIVVALNKIDVPNANVNRVMGQLAEHGLQPREWGGDTEVIQTSAETGAGVEDLVETLSLEAQLLELTADPASSSVGSVIEAEMDPGRGVVARVLVRDGTLRVGDVLLAGPGYGRVRQMINDRGVSIEEAGPATPVEVSGLDEVPTAGDKFYVLKDISEAKNIADEVRDEQREEKLATKQQITLDNLFDQISAGDVSELPLIIKADVQGSVEVLVDSLNKLSTNEVRVKILHAAVGAVASSDVLLAEASGAIILGFHVIADAVTREQADRLGVDIRLYRVIYELIDEVTQAMQGMLAPEISEKVLGHAEVRDVFKVTRVGTIAGCYVTDGTVLRNAKIRVTRDGIVIEDERVLESLKRFKDDAREVRGGMECGMKISGYDDVKVGDVLEAYQTVETAREL